MEINVKKYYSISTNDKQHFKYIVDVLNGCFGRNYSSIYSCMKMSFCHIDDDHMLWFPKMATKKKGQWKAPARAQGWLNYLVNNNSVIIEEKEDDNRIINEKSDDALPRYTFGWYQDTGYVFLGVYKANIKNCRAGHFEYIRIANEINLQKYHTGNFKIKIPSIDEIHANEVIDNTYINELKHKSLSNTPKNFVYKAQPQKVKNPILKEGIKIYPRNKQTAINALIHANYCCEIDSNHPSFIRKSSNKNYTEPHHLVPMAFQEQFDVSLDVEENIVSLCSNCHNEIHYGRYADSLLKKLYAERKNILANVGIHISLNDLLIMYGYNSIQN